MLLFYITNCSHTVRTCVCVCVSPFTTKYQVPYLSPVFRIYDLSRFLARSAEPPVVGRLSRQIERHQRVKVEQILLAGRVPVAPGLHRRHAAVLDDFHLGLKRKFLLGLFRNSPQRFITPPRR